MFTATITVMTATKTGWGGFMVPYISAIALFPNLVYRMPNLGCMGTHASPHVMKQLNVFSASRDR